MAGADCFLEEKKYKERGLDANCVFLHEAFVRRTK